MKGVIPFIAELLDADLPANKAAIHCSLLHVGPGVMKGSCISRLDVDWSAMFI